MFNLSGPVEFLFYCIDLIYIHLGRECDVVIVVHVVVVDLPLLRVAVEGSDNPISLEKPFQASLPPDQQRHHSLGRHPKVPYAV